MPRTRRSTVGGLLVAAQLAAACGPKDWREARLADTSAAYRAYASAHAGEPRASIASRRAAQRAWDEAVASKTSAGYASYLAIYPGGEHAAEARAQAEVLGWEEASAAGTIAALSGFVADYPKSPHVPEALVTIEDLWHADAKAEGTESSWGRYLVRYPMGRYALEAQAERDRLVWQQTVTDATRYAYRRYLDRFPMGVHVAEARLWLANTYVRTLQPVVALVACEGPPCGTSASTRAALITQVQRAFDGGLVADLRPTFVVLPTKGIDATNGLDHPQISMGTQPDTGILVLEYGERPGRAFEPTGQATDVTAVLRLYAPNTANPVWSRELTATTPERVRGTDLTALHAAAVRDLSDQLRGVIVELVQQRRPEGT